MRVLEALKILEAATIECKTRDIDMPEVKEALDVLAPYCRPEWKITGFRDNLKRREQEFGPGGEGQQQILRVSFSGIYGDVRALLQRKIGALEFQYRRTEGAAAKDELDRLTIEFERMPERWNFVERRP